MLVEEIDHLFDSLNGDTPDPKRGKKYLSNITRRSPHLQYYKKMKEFFKEMTFVGARTKPPSQDGFIKTLNAVKRLFTNLETICNVKSLSPEGSIKTY